MGYADTATHRTDGDWGQANKDEEEDRKKWMREN